MDLHLEDWHEGVSGFAKGPVREWNESPEEGLQAIERLRNPVVVGRGDRRVAPFALCCEGHQDAERVFRAELVAFREDA
jgi:hypothetical protein